MNIKKRRKRRKSIKKRNSHLVIFLCVILITIFVSINVFFENKKDNYFDVVNSLVSYNEEYVTVGSNNDNKKKLEKAKVSKYNKNKEKVFDKLYNVGFNSKFYGVINDGSDIVAVGSYEKDEYESELSHTKALIVKYDENGDIIFENDFKILDVSKFTNIKKVDDGYIVTGQSISNEKNKSNNDGGAILVKYDLDGNLLWSKTYGDRKSAIFNDLLIKDSYIYTVGLLKNNIGVICKFDLDGNFISYNDYKYTDVSGFNSLTLINNKLYVCGTNKVSENDFNAMIVEYDLDCNYIRQAIYDYNNSSFSKIISDNHNNLIVIGTKYIKNKANYRKRQKNTDGIIGKYNSNLDEVSIVTYGDLGEDYFTDVKLVDDDYLTIGYSSYDDGSYLSKFIRFSDALKVLEVE